jgi:HME family heavy-metal exporter
MLDHVIRQALRFRGLVVLSALVGLIYGSHLATTLLIDVFPDLDRPRVVLLTECPGLAPEEIETLIAQPIETAILGAPGVQAVRSQASQGLAVTYVEFGWSTEVRYARQIVQERLTVVTDALPPGIRPLLTPPSSIMGQIMIVGVYRQKGPRGGDLTPVGATGILAERGQSDNPADWAYWRVVDRHQPQTWQRIPPDSALRRASATVRFPTPEAARMELRTLADWVIRPRLLKEAGVAEVIVMGGDRKQYQVLVDPNQLLEFGVTLQDVDRAIQDNNLNASGGFTEEGQVERPIRVLGRLGPRTETLLDDLRKLPVKANRARSVLLGQVATITEGPAPKRGDSGVDGLDAVVINLVKQPHTDTRELTDRVKHALHEVERSFPADLVVNTDLFQLRDFIDRSVYYVGEALVIGAGLIIVILFLFLLNLRTTFITLTAIPLALVVTLLVFRLLGWLTGTELSINVMTLGGIAVAMGELVDDAIVDVENIFRRLRENRVAPTPRSALVVIYDASREIRSAIVFGTAVVVLAFLPLFALSGIEGRLFVPLGLAYIVSILASLVVSLTVTPVLSYYLLGHLAAGRQPTDSSDRGLLRLLKWGAAHLIHFSMRFALPLLVLTWLMVAYCGWRLSQLGADFLPKFDEGSIQLNLTLPAGSSLAATNEAARAIDAKLKTWQQSADHPTGPIRHFVRRSGRAERDEHAEPVSRSEYILSLNPQASESRQPLLAKLLRELRAEVPGADLEAEQPLAHMISHMISGVNAQIAIKVFGDDLDQLQKLATQIKAVITDLPGLTPLVIDPQELVDELHIVLRQDDLAAFGLSRKYVAQFVETALKGEVVCQVLDGQRRFDLVVKLNAAYRTDYRQLGELRIDLPAGTGQVRLKEVADLPDAASGPNQINHDNGRRRAVIRSNVSGRDLASVVADIEKRVQTGVPLPEGYFVEFGGQFAAQRSATRLIAFLALMSVTGVFVVLYLLFPSVRICLQILNAVPTAFVGGVFALVLTNQTLTVASLVGFVSLGGIAVRNGILLVTHYLHLLKEEGEAFTPALVLRGSLERLAPVLMTALTAGIGLLPLVVGGQKPGLEILYPVATVILGGLLTSTFCEFLIHPGLFWQFSGQEAERCARQTEVEEI